MGPRGINPELPANIAREEVERPGVIRSFPWPGSERDDCLEGACYVPTGGCILTASAPGD